MCVTERKFPETLPWRSAAWIVFCSLVFSHVFPLLIEVVIHLFKIPVNPLSGLFLTAHLLIVGALILIGIILGGAKAKWGIHWVTLSDVGVIIPCWLISVFGVGFISMKWKWLLTRWHLNFEETQGVIKLAQNCSTPVFWSLFVMVAIIVPIFEEITYRRALFSLTSPLGKWAACILSAAIFSAVHLYIVVFPGLWFFAIVLQWSFFKTKNLAVPITIHALFNALSVLASHFLAN